MCRFHIPCAVFILLTTTLTPCTANAELLESSAPGNLVRVGNVILFFADDGLHGRELWRSDGTPEGTRLMADLAPGNATSNPRLMVSDGNTAYFTAEVDPGFPLLWKTFGIDGDLIKTGPGTTAEFSIIENTSIAAGRAFFYSSSEEFSRVLWESNGTVAATHRILQESDKASIHNWYSMRTLRGMPIFVGFSSDVGFVLYICPDLSGIAKPIIDIAPGNDMSLLSMLEICGDIAYFSGDTGATGMELWRTDGTSEGTRLVCDINPGPEPSNPQWASSIGDRTVIRARRADVGEELWITDGTETGTTLLKDIAPGIGDSFPYSPIRLGNRLVFVASDGINGAEPWITDGTAEGTYMLADLNTGPVGSEPYQLERIGDLVFFGATVANAGDELCVTNGTARGTRMVTEIRPGPENGGVYNLEPLGDAVLFSADHAQYGVELWRSDGTAEGTTMLRDIYPPLYKNLSSRPKHLTPIDDTVFFAANDVIHGIELWRSDGTPENTRLVEDINPGPESSAPKELCRGGNALYFTAESATQGRELRITTLDTIATLQLSDLAPGTDSSDPSQLFWSQNQSRLYFVATTTALGQELYTATDSVELLMDIAKGPESSLPREFTTIGNITVFSAWSRESARELWATDGTTSGTKRIADIFPGEKGSNPRGFIQIGEFLYFVADDTPSQHHVWRTDGTPDGTGLATEWPAEFSADAIENPNLRTVNNNELYFVYNDAIHGAELWRTTLQPGGTHLVRDIFPGRASSNPANLTTALGVVWFRAENGANGAELWQSNGTIEGTRLVVDLNPGVASSGLNSMVNYRDMLLYVADGGKRYGGGGVELWSTSARGSGIVAEIQAQNASSNPHTLTPANSKFFFVADDGVHGDELWVTDGSTDGTMFVKDILPRRPAVGNAQEITVSKTP